MIFVDMRSAQPLYKQIKDSIRGQVLRGLLQPDEKLPSVRELAASAAINPNTIQRAYRELEAEGVIYSAPGRGCFVAAPSGAQRQKRRDELLARLAPLVDELVALGMAEDEICQWLKGGRNDDD